MGRKSCRGLSCEVRREGALLVCPKVPAAGLSPSAPFVYDELAFGFRLRDLRLVNLTTLRTRLERQEATRGLQDLELGLAQGLGAPASRGAGENAFVAYRFADYLAEVSAMPLPRRGYDASGATAVVPTLVVNRDNPTASPEYWRSLRATAQEAKGDVAPAAVSSAVALAEEALHYLTHHDELAPGQALSLERARRLLAGFKFDESHGDSEVQDEVEALVSGLSGDLAVDEICKTLVGDLQVRAAYTARAV